MSFNGKWNKKAMSILNSKSILLYLMLIIKKKISIENSESLLGISSDDLINGSAYEQMNS